MKDVERPGAFIQTNNTMTDTAGDTVHVASLEYSILVTNEEVSPAFQQHAHLLVRVRVQFDD